MKTINYNGNDYLLTCAECGMVLPINDVIRDFMDKIIEIKLEPCQNIECVLGHSLNKIKFKYMKVEDYEGIL
jgi:hypothetical protein